MSERLRCGDCRQASILGPADSSWRGCPITDPPLARYKSEICWASPDQVHVVCLDGLRRASAALGVMTQALPGMTKEERESMQEVARDIFHKVAVVEQQASGLLTKTLEGGRLQ